MLCIRRIVIHSHFPEASSKLFRNPGTPLELIILTQAERTRNSVDQTCALWALRARMSAPAQPSERATQ